MVYSFLGGFSHWYIYKEAQMKAFVVLVVVVLATAFHGTAVAQDMSHDELRVRPLYGQTLNFECGASVLPYGGETWYPWRAPKVELIESVDDRQILRIWYGRCLAEYALGYSYVTTSIPFMDGGSVGVDGAPWTFVIYDGRLASSEEGSIQTSVCTIQTAQGWIYAVKVKDTLTHTHGENGVASFIYTDIFRIPDGVPECRLTD